MTKEEEYIGMNDAVFYYVSGDEYCKIPETLSWDNERCDRCPLNELEAKE